jgi:hypothetical protein
VAVSSEVFYSSTQHANQLINTKTNNNNNNNNNNPTITNIMMAPNVPTVDNMIALSPHPTLPRVSAEGNCNELVELRNSMKENVCSVYTRRGGGNYGHLGDLLADTMYATIAPNIPYIVPPNSAPQPVIEAGTTLINKENLLRAYDELKRENIEHKNLESTRQETNGRRHPQWITLGH